MNPSEPSLKKLRQAYIVSSLSAGAAYNEALSVAKAAVCRSGGSEACGQCPSCLKAAAGIHPDIRVIERLTDEKGKLRKEIIVEQVREVVADAAVMPNEAARKVYIFQEGDLLNIPAQNAALKLLEEPPAWAVVIICVTQAGHLLETVRSRCTEITVAAADEASDEESAEAAKEFLSLAAADDMYGLFLFCESRNGISPREMGAFVNALTESAADIICGRAQNPGLSEEYLLSIAAIMDKCTARLKANVSVKQLFGLIEAEAVKGNIR